MINERKAVDTMKEKGLSKVGEPVLHVHEYPVAGIQNRQKGRHISMDEYKKYRKYFKGVK